MSTREMSLLSPSASWRCRSTPPTRSGCPNGRPSGSFSSWRSEDRPPQRPDRGGRREGRKRRKRGSTLWRGGNIFGDFSQGSEYLAGVFLNNVALSIFKNSIRSFRQMLLLPSCFPVCRSIYVIWRERLCLNVNQLWQTSEDHMQFHLFAVFLFRFCHGTGNGTLSLI